MSAVTFDKAYTEECAKLGDLILKKEGIEAQIARVRYNIKKIHDAKAAFEIEKEKWQPPLKDEAQKSFDEATKEVLEKL